MRNRKRGITLFFSRKNENDIVVRDNLALTPKDMYAMARAGQPITAAVKPFTDGDSNPSWNIPLESVRGIDIAELWEQQDMARKNILRAHKTDVKREKQLKKSE